MSLIRRLFRKREQDSVVVQPSAALTYLDTPCPNCGKNKVYLEQNGRPWCVFCGTWAVKRDDVPIPAFRPSWEMVSKGGKTLRKLWGTPQFEDEIIKCEDCGHDLGTRRAIREAAEEQGWQSSYAIGVRGPCPSCGKQQWIIL